MRFSIIILLIALTSCSSFKRTVVTAALTGAIVGAVGGAAFSPDEESRDRNTYLFGVAGAVAAAGTAFLFRDGPMNKNLQTPMLLDEDRQTHKEVPLFDFSPQLKNIKPEVTFKPIKKFEVPLEKLPKSLEGKVKKQYIIEYEAEARTLNIGSRTIQISPFKAWEHVYEEQ
jgi:hypothetical protein